MVRPDTPGSLHPSSLPAAPTPGAPKLIGPDGSIMPHIPLLAAGDAPLRPAAARAAVAHELAASTGAQVAPQVLAPAPVVPMSPAMAAAPPLGAPMQVVPAPPAPPTPMQAMPIDVVAQLHAAPAPTAAPASSSAVPGIDSPAAHDVLGGVFGARADLHAATIDPNRWFPGHVPEAPRGPEPVPPLQVAVPGAAPSLPGASAHVHDAPMPAPGHAMPVAPVGHAAPSPGTLPVAMPMPSAAPSATEPRRRRSPLRLRGRSPVCARASPPTAPHRRRVGAAMPMPSPMPFAASMAHAVPMAQVVPEPIALAPSSYPAGSLQLHGVTINGLAQAPHLAPAPMAHAVAAPAGDPRRDAKSGALLAKLVLLPLVPAAVVGGAWLLSVVQH